MGSMLPWHFWYIDDCKRIYCSGSGSVASILSTTDCLGQKVDTTFSQRDWGNGHIDGIDLGEGGMSQYDKKFRLINLFYLWPQVPASNWQDILELLFPEGSLGCPAPQSSCPDILFNNRLSMVGWQAKLVTEKSAVTWSGKTFYLLSWVRSTHHHPPIAGQYYKTK